MQVIKHRVLHYENIYLLMHQYNLSIDMLVNSNARKYPSLLSDPFRIYYGWELDIPIVSNGNNTQYGVGGE